MQPALAFLLIGAIHSYHGNDPAQWRTAQAGAQPATAAAPDTRIAFSRYAGDQYETTIARITVDAAGNTYVVGSRSFPIRDSPLSDVLVAKVDPAGNTIYTTYLGGKGFDQGFGIAADSAGNAWVVGRTTSPNFPVRNPLFPRPAGGFVAKLDPTGLLVFSTYWGDVTFPSHYVSGGVNAVAVDSAGAAYVTGETGFYENASGEMDRGGFPTTPNAFQKAPNGPCGAYLPCSATFVTKFSPAGALVYSTYVGLSGARTCMGGSSCLFTPSFDFGLGIAVDASGNAYITGTTNRPTLPAAPAGFQKQREGIGPFVAKLNAEGSAVLYSSFLGGRPMPYPKMRSSGDEPAAIAVDRAGNAYVAGQSGNSGFPVTNGALQTTFAGPPSGFTPPGDGFLSKISADGNSLVYSTYIGGASADIVNGVAVDAQGSAYITGTTQSADFRRGDPSLPSGSGFLLELDPTGSAVTYAARLPNGVAGQDVALDSRGRIHLAGASAIVSTLNPGASPAPTIVGISNAAGMSVSGRVAPLEVVSLWGQDSGPATPATGAVDASGNAPTTLAGVQVLFDGAPAQLLYVSNQQINAVAPATLSSLTTKVKVVYSGIETPEFPLYVVSALPEIFKTPDGVAAALNEDGTINSTDHPAKAGSIVAVWVTGVGPSFYPSISVNVTPAEILYAGPAPTLVNGVYQINFRIPNDAIIGLTSMSLQGGDYAGIYTSP